MYSRPQHYLKQNNEFCTSVYLTPLPLKTTPHREKIVGGQHGNSGRINLLLPVVKSQISIVTSDFSWLAISSPNPDSLQLLLILNIASCL
jgi:hypothetical protein